MEKIVKITKEKSQFYLVWLTSGEHLRVSEDILVRYRLLKDQEISDSIIAEIKKAGSYDVGLQLALNYLSYQMRTKKEIRDYLRDKEFEKSDREKIINQLVEMQLLDDYLYSESYVRTLMKTSDKGPQQIKQQLKKKGVEDEAIQQGLAAYTLSDQLLTASKAAEKGMHRYRDKSFKDAVQKTKLYLIQRGFSKAIVEQAITDLEFEKDEDQELTILQTQGDRLWERNRSLEPAKRKLKVKQSLYQKGFDYELISQFINEKEQEADGE
ncbi:recombination regulator RecX [Enterococcus sp. BWT-B8]|uniref:recombination regulator RecX n=1 Tax=Enterococcus sp. BWT-B8 TaxID=2885157 RepID=UPI001E42A336|nr:recombination regulator RecX [Enterococcus sp. BWT-B8]MCB5952284.1 recombination regulator RecX [Enterococcus sp. BWT-B8]